MSYLTTIYNYKKGNYPYILADYLFMQYMVEGYKLLDIGCGVGTYIEQFEKLHMEVYGVDRDISHIYHPNLRQCNFEKDRIPFANNSFDYIFCKSTIEHIENVNHLLSEAYRVLVPLGKIIILTPAWEYNYKWFYDDPTHIKPFCRKGLQDALKIAGFNNVNINYFYHLRYTWYFSFLKIIPKLIQLMPNKFRWKDKEETIPNTPIRFSKEVQLLGVATKRQIY